PVIGGLIRAKLLIMRGWSTPKEANPLPITASLPARSSGRTNWQPYGRLSTLAGRATPQRSSPAETAPLRPGLTLFFVHLLSEPHLEPQERSSSLRIIYVRHCAGCRPNLLMPTP